MAFRGTTKGKKIALPVSALLFACLLSMWGEGLGMWLSTAWLCMYIYGLQVAVALLVVTSSVQLIISSSFSYSMYTVSFPRTMLFEATWKIMHIHIQTLFPMPVLFSPGCTYVEEINMLQDDISFKYVTSKLKQPQLCQNVDRFSFRWYSVIY